MSSDTVGESTQVDKPEECGGSAVLDNPQYRGLTPWKPGQSGNPTGRNQYSYRRDWEAEVELRLAGKVNGTRESVLESICDRLLTDAVNGKAWAMKEVLKRVWPEVVKHELIPNAAPPTVSPLENLNDEDRNTMLRLAQKAIRGQ